jgi:hypothetical protein
MGYFVGLLILAAIALGVYWKFFRKSRLVEKPIQRRVMELLKTPPDTIATGERFQIEYQIVERPSGRILSELHNWRVERDPNAPLGGPDIPCLYVDSTGLVTGIAMGERTIYATFVETPDKHEISFKVRVV